MEELKFPIGRLQLQDDYTKEEVLSMIDSIAAVPQLYRQICENLTETQLLNTYREGSWNIKQLVHHVADMHLLHFFRMKKALTEPDYKEATLVNMNGWAETADSTNDSIDDSLMILEGIHRRYMALAKSLSEDQLNIKYYHVVRERWFDQKQALATTDWHGKHHLAHIKLALG